MLLLMLVVLNAAPGGKSLTADALTARADATQRAMQQTGARWTMRRALGKAADLGVRVTRFGDETHWELIVIEAGKVQVLRTITESRGVHVTRRPALQPEVTRPWEEVLDSQWMVLIRRTAPAFFHSSGAATLLSDDGKVSRWRVPVSDTFVSAIKKVTTPFDGGLPETEALERALVQGVVASVDDATGLILHAEPDEARGTFFSDFEVLRERPSVFAEPAAKPPPPITAAWMKDAVAWGWVPSWKPGGNEGEADTVLVREDAHEVRRVPNSLGPSFQVAFLSPTKVVTITPSMQAGFVPVLVDLETGESRWLGNWEPGTIVLFPRASPDGRHVSLHVNGALTKNQLVVMEIATGALRKIGAEADQAFSSWLSPTSFLLVRREDSVPRVVKLDLDGKETLVREKATSPVPLGDGKRLLFRDAETREWRTCDLSGRNEKRVGDGLVKAFDPAISRDGKVLLFIESTPEFVRHFVDLESGETIRAPAPLPGRWATPVFP